MASPIESVDHLGVSAVNNGHSNFLFINEILTLVRTNESVTVVNPAKSTAKSTALLPTYHYHAVFPKGNPDSPLLPYVTLDLTLIVDSGTLPTDITNVTGTVTYFALGLPGTYSITFIQWPLIHWSVTQRHISVIWALRSLMTIKCRHLSFKSPRMT